MNKKKLSHSNLNSSITSVLAALLCIVIGMAVGFLVLLAINPAHAWGDGFVRIIKGGFHDAPYGVGKELANAAPLIMTGLSVAFAFKTGQFNNGAAGQLAYIHRLGLDILQLLQHGRRCGNANACRHNLCFGNNNTGRQITAHNQLNRNIQRMHLAYHIGLHHYTLRDNSHIRNIVTVVTHSNQLAFRLEAAGMDADIYRSNHTVYLVNTMCCTTQSNLRRSNYTVADGHITVHRAHDTRSNGNLFLAYRIHIYGNLLRSYGYNLAAVFRYRYRLSLLSFCYIF